MLDIALVTTHFQKYYKYYVPEASVSYIYNTGTIPDLITWTEFLGDLSPDQEAQRFINDWNVPIRMYWINIGWVGDGSFKPTCSYLKNLAMSLEKYSGKKVGFISNSNAWILLFQSQFACSELGGYPLFAWLEEGNDFIPFGGWASPNIRFGPRF
jgi:hypothetical protein